MGEGSKIPSEWLNLWIVLNYTHTHTHIYLLYMRFLKYMPMIRLNLHVEHSKRLAIMNSNKIEQL